MAKPAILRIIAVIIAGYGIYVTQLLLGLLLGASAPLLSACLFVQACAAIAAALGLWRGAGWAPAATVVLGAAIAVTELIEGPVLGLIAVDRAVLVGAAAVLAALAIAVYAARSRRVVIVA